jgi:GT2 family glycosyltransferase
MKTLIGIVTFGNLPFTKLCVDEIIATTKSEISILVIVGKPDDVETKAWATSMAANDNLKIGFGARIHTRNHGFPASCNDLIDDMKRMGFENLILVGNDVVVYPRAVDALIQTAETTDYEWVCGSQFDVQSLCARYPEARQFFTGDRYEFTDFKARPWELHKDFHEGLEPAALKDVQNLCLYKRSVFEKIGYFDVNFWPNGYFSDNDYARRGNLAQVKAVGVKHAAYFHFWSRTIHQGESRPNGKYFSANAEFYQEKWGGPVNGETFKLPFNGGSSFYGYDARTRVQESAVIKHWELRS